MRNRIKFLSILMIMLQPLPLLLSAGVGYRLLPLMNNVDGRIKGCVMQDETSGLFYALMRLQGYSVNESSILLLDDAGTAQGLVPLRWVGKPKSGSVRSITPIDFGENNEIFQIDPEFVESMEGWNVVTFDDAGGTETPALRAYPLALSESQVQRLEFLPVMVPLSDSSPPSGGLLFNGPNVVGLALQDGPISSRLRGGSPAASQSGGTRIIDRKVSLNLHLLSLLDGVSEQSAEPKELLESFSWRDGEPSHSEPVKKLELRMKALQGISSEVRVAVKQRYQHSDATYDSIPMSETDQSGVFLCEVDTRALYPEREGETWQQWNDGSYCEITLETEDLKMKANVRDVMVETSKGPSLLSQVYETLGDSGPVPKGADVRGIQNICEELSGKALIRWEDVQWFSAKKLKADFTMKLLLVAQVKDSKGEWQRVANLDVSASSVQSSDDDADKVADENLRAINYTIALKKPKYKRLRFSGDGKYIAGAYEEGPVTIRDRKTLKALGTIDTEAIPAIRSTFTLSLDRLYALDVSKKRILRFELPSGQYLGDLKLSDFGFDREAKLIGFQVSPLAVNEMILTVFDVNSETGKILHVDIKRKYVLSSKSLTARQMHDLGSKTSTLVPYLFMGSGSFGQDCIVMHSDSPRMYRHKNFLPYRLVGFGHDVSYRSQEVAVEYFKNAFKDYKGRINPSWAETTPTVTYGEKYYDSDVDEFLVIEEPVHLVRREAEPFRIQLPIHTKQKPIKLQILLAPNEYYSLDEEQNLVLSSEALPQADPDFLLMRVTSAKGKSFDFWVSVDRRESAYVITD